MNFNIKSKQQGFTIVELLIVIVVIGILAAITIVAYNGIQNRGKAAAGQAAANALMKKAEAFNTVNSVYPSYCQLVTNSNTPTGAAPSAGTAGVGTCVAGGTSAGPEAKLDSVAGITLPSAAAGTSYTSTVSNGNAVIAYWACGASTGANIYYWDYSSGAISTKMTAGTGC
jgi:prepilin-type N-terminal cleavage/methylation domain-containing protein